MITDRNLTRSALHYQALATFAAVAFAVLFTVLVMRHIDGETPTPGDGYSINEDNCYLTYDGPRDGVKGPKSTPITLDVREYRCFR